MHAFADPILPFISHRIHVWYIYLHLPSKKDQLNVGKYSSPMDPMGFGEMYPVFLKFVAKSE